MSRLGIITIELLVIGVFPEVFNFNAWDFHAKNGGTVYVGSIMHTRLQTT